MGAASSNMTIHVEARAPVLSDMTPAIIPPEISNIDLFYKI